MLKDWENLCERFTPEKLITLLRRTASAFRPTETPLDSYIKEQEPFNEAVQLGRIELSSTQTVIVVTVRVQGELTARAGKRKQYDLAKRIVRSGNYNAGIFAFYDNTGCFRFSLVSATYHGTRREYSSFRRYTFFVNPELPNKTFLQQMGRANFETLSGILKTFSLEAVSKEFYSAFKSKFDDIANGVKGTKNEELRKDFALLFAIRVIFLGFVQKKGWLNNDPRFLQSFWQEHLQSGSKDSFYKEWLEPLFFDALSSPPGASLKNVPFSSATQKALREAPYLNGELFKRKQGVDDVGLVLPDRFIGDFFDFLFQYNFTVEENELYDEELELNPEFLGIIFERITNKDQGAVYTPRVEVDLMCRLSLVKWLEQTTNIIKKELYRFFFREIGTGLANDRYQKQGDFSADDIQVLITRLENVTVCDPAAGSGAFEVGMLQVIDQALEDLYSRDNTPEELKAVAPTPFERKKAIIAQSLYGVEVKRWAVWINHLRLWLTLFVDMPDDFKANSEPLLPNLTFKVRTGDSLVQRIGNKIFPVQGHAKLPKEVKAKLAVLKQKKRDFFYNKGKDYKHIEQEELEVFHAILDAGIEEFQKEIRALSGPKHKQGDFLEDTVPSKKQSDQDSVQKNEAKVARLEAEIAELENRKESLKDERPFVWSIEFAEIFFDSGGFDVIIGNPPYLRHEDISDPNGLLRPEEYKAALREMLLFDFPSYFAKSLAQTDQFKEERKPSGRSDLYTYFYVRSLRLVNPQGVHVFICSISWLDVGYGAWLQEFFLRQVPLHLVIDNHARRSFDNADVNTIITVASAPEGVNDDHEIRFVAFKQPFEETVFSENLWEIDQAKMTVKTPGFRVFPITVGELLREGSEVRQMPEGIVDSNQDGRYLGDKWGGKYLRAPDIFFTILEKGKDKLVRLGEIAAVRFGIKTGANAFFYLKPLGPGSRSDLLRVRNDAGWEGEIEEEFLKPVVKSSRECHGVTINPKELRYRLFMCFKSKAELKGTRALEYIEWGEKRGYRNRSSLKERKQWWSLGSSRQELVAWALVQAGRHNVSINPYRVELDNNFLGIHFLDNWEYYGAFLAVSTLAVLVKELVGRSYGGGSGPIKTQGADLEKMIFLHPAHLGHIPVKKIKDLVSGIPYISIFCECGVDPYSGSPISAQDPDPMPGRKKVDDIVFDALDLTEDERKDVYRAVCQLVWNRISKAGSVKRNG